VRIGVLGGGQLGRMLALAGIPLGHQFVFLEPGGEAVRGLGEVIAASADDTAALAQLVAKVDVVTYEFENVPVSAANFVAARKPVHPPPDALGASQDRIQEKRLFRDLGIPTADFAPVDTRPALDKAVATLGLPAVLKTRRLGYDGKGQRMLRAPVDLGPAWGALGDAPLVLEAFVPFEHELSVLAVRARDGAVAVYPLVENVHRGGILRRSLAPAPGLTPAVQAAAEDYARRVLDRLRYVGVLAIELFQVGDRLVANEMAPRVHNSGHWTIDGAETSQFENHVRAITGMPLGATAARGSVAMVNLIGTLPDSAAILAVPGAHLHVYGKEPKPGRKLGHVTLVGQAPAVISHDLAVVERLAAGA
jgi:5-(carboxyamino)imidazole ribonucleotide synthase